MARLNGSDQPTGEWKPVGVDQHGPRSFQIGSGTSLTTARLDEDGDLVIENQERECKGFRVCFDKHALHQLITADEGRMGSRWPRDE